MIIFLLKFRGAEYDDYRCGAGNYFPKHYLVVASIVLSLCALWFTEWFNENRRKKTHLKEVNVKKLKNYWKDGLDLIRHIFHRNRKKIHFITRFIWPSFDLTPQKIKKEKEWKQKDFIINLPSPKAHLFNILYCNVLLVPQLIQLLMLSQHTTIQQKNTYIYIYLNLSPNKIKVMILLCFFSIFIVVCSLFNFFIAVLVQHGR